MSSNPIVGIIMGSDSDLPVMKKAIAVLKEFEIQKDRQKLDHSISLSRLRNGLYILQIEGNGEIISHKVLKK